MGQEAIHKYSVNLDGIPSTIFAKKNFLFMFD